MTQNQAVLVQLQDIDQAQKSSILFRSQQNSTIKDTIELLKSQIGFQYEFEILLQGQFHKIRETELLSSLFNSTQQRVLQYKKIEQKSQQPQIEIKTQNFTNNFNNKDQIKLKSQPFLQQYNQQKFQENQQQQQVLQTQTNLTEQIKQICETYFNQYNIRLKSIEDEMYKQKNYISQQSQLIEKMQNKFIKQDQQLQMIPKDNLNDWKTQIESQIKNLYQLIQNQNPPSPQSPFVLQTGSNKMNANRQNFETITPIPVMMTELKTQSFIKLTCKDQIEKNKLEEILQNAIIQGNLAYCIYCPKKISQINYRQLGQLGDWYIQFSNEKNLNQLQQQLMKNNPQKILKCNNRNCNFFCILTPQCTVLQKNYCPICLVFSVQSYQLQYQQNFRQN